MRTRRCRKRRKQAEKDLYVKSPKKSSVDELMAYRKISALLSTQRTIHGNTAEPFYGELQELIDSREKIDLAEMRK